ncbi:MAG: hypothetical protein IE937_08060 [Gammaproteobacteria bacterium]|uniref:Uncharacterized protein n=1 Tax=Thioclava marina TaxID=1915077 RepID=A0ABX3MJB5_9RHOB|nr:hypothetical protein [Thioclava marina]MBD3755581.1 hypothetical protein [Gammaproteobacteria bacterium]OOY11650.1 hypothetical protein BMG00_11135 [Thioclava marina]
MPLILKESISSELRYHADRYDYFRSVARPGARPETSVSTWLQSAGLPALASVAETTSIGRRELKEMAENPDCPDRDALWAILGWGKMRRDHARTLARNEDKWLAVGNRLRSGDLSRSEGYALCHAVMNSITRPGIGPAYFTKLIFFAEPKHDGYIMDQ